MNLKKARSLYKKIEEGEVVDMQSPYVQRWWIVEKSVESPESDRVFSHVVGVLRRKKDDLKKPYRQEPVLVLLRKPTARVGLALNWTGQNVLGQGSYMKLSPIDYTYQVFPGWD
jgi:hypothetical protein